MAEYISIKELKNSKIDFASRGSKHASGKAKRKRIDHLLVDKPDKHLMLTEPEHESLLSIGE